MSRAFERMRLHSHAQIKRKIATYEQLLQGISQRINRQKTCRYNAHSAFLLCAVNPSGPCSECIHYQPIEGE